MKNDRFIFNQRQHENKNNYSLYIDNRRYWIKFIYNFILGTNKITKEKNENGKKKNNIRRR